jgi:DNA-binding ferritin-like protein
MRTVFIVCVIAALSFTSLAIYKFFRITQSVKEVASEVTKGGKKIVGKAKDIVEEAEIPERVAESVEKVKDNIDKAKDKYGPKMRRYLKGLRKNNKKDDEDEDF